MSIPQEQDEKDKRSFCNSCRKGDAKFDSNGVLRLSNPAIPVLGFALLASLFSACGSESSEGSSLDGSSDAQGAQGAQGAQNAPSDTAYPSSEPRPMGPPSPQAPGTDAGVAIAGQDASGDSATDARVMDGGSAGGDVRGTDVPPILRPKLDAGGSCQSGSVCPMVVDEGSGIYSLKSGITKPPMSCIFGTQFSSAGVYWFQDYQGKRYVFSIVGTCEPGAAQPYKIFPYVKIEDVNPECGALNDRIQLYGEWYSLVGPHTFVETGALDGVSCANKRGRCFLYQCYDPSGKVVR